MRRQVCVISARRVCASTWARAVAISAVITALIASARAHVEAQTRRALITQTWRLIRDDWPPDGRVAVAPVPLRSVVAARVYDAGGTAHAIDPAVFVADKGAAPAV